MNKSYIKLWIVVHLFIFYETTYCQIEYITTIHPFKEILVNIVGSRASVNELLAAGVSPHTFLVQPSIIKKVQNSTAFFYGAPNLDGWAQKISHHRRIELMNLIPENFRLTINSSDHHHSGEYDPHFWHDPLTIKSMLPHLCDTLSALDPGGQTIYEENAHKFSLKLDSIYYAILEELEGVNNRNVFLSHPFFLYYLNRYNFFTVAILELNPGVEATPKELMKFSLLAKKSKVNAILTQKSLSDRIASLVAESASLKLISLDALGGLPFTNRYEKLMQYNTQQLKAGLLE